MVHEARGMLQIFPATVRENSKHFNHLDDGLSWANAEIQCHMLYVKESRYSHRISVALFATSALPSATPAIHTFHFLARWPCTVQIQSNISTSMQFVISGHRLQSRLSAVSPRIRGLLTPKIPNLFGAKTTHSTLTSALPASQSHDKSCGVIAVFRNFGGKRH